MRGSHPSQRAILAAVVAIATLTVSSSSTRAPELTGISGRLVSIQQLQTDFGDLCNWVPAETAERTAASEASP